MDEWIKPEDALELTFSDSFLQESEKVSFIIEIDQTVFDYCKENELFGVIKLFHISIQDGNGINEAEININESSAAFDKWMANLSKCGLLLIDLIFLGKNGCHGEIKKIELKEVDNLKILVILGNPRPTMSKIIG